MEISELTLDDLLFKVFSELLRLDFSNTASRTEKHGPFSEIFGVLLEIKNPLARLSRSDTKGKIFSAVGEFLWYFTKKDSLDFIEYYLSDYREESEDGVSVYGGYGPRLFNSDGKYNQIENIIALLQKNPTSKKAIIQLFEARDIDYELSGRIGSIPCTCTLSFLQRSNKLHMMTHMRSNDAYKGLPHDVFAFTMIQEYIANRLGCQIGTYKHSIASLHLYASNKRAAEEYLEEGRQDTDIFMARMPEGDQTKPLNIILQLEEKIRNNSDVNLLEYELDPYWIQLAYLLKFFKADRQPRDLNKMEKLRGFVTDTNYGYILDRRIRTARNKK